MKQQQGGLAQQQESLESLLKEFNAINSAAGALKTNEARLKYISDHRLGPECRESNQMLYRIIDFDTHVVLTLRYDAALPAEIKAIHEKEMVSMATAERYLHMTPTKIREAIAKGALQGTASKVNLKDMNAKLGSYVKK